MTENFERIDLLIGILIHYSISNSVIEFLNSDLTDLLKGLASIAIVLLAINGHFKVESLDLLQKINQYLDKLYSLKEHRIACKILPIVDVDLQSVDSLLFTPMEMLFTFNKCICNVKCTDALDVIFWNEFNDCAFTAPPLIHKIICSFRLLLHGNCMTILTRRWFQK